jgi:Cft2 family RNA processing exonuclease
MVMFATPGNLSTGVSLDILRVWCGDARNVVVVPGYCFANTLAARLQEGCDSGEGMDIRCTLLNMSFSAHADARGITRTIRRLKPRAVMLVHRNVVLGGAFTKTNVKSTVVAGEKPILEHSEATIATVSDALTTAQDNNFICSRDQLAENPPV